MKIPGRVIVTGGAGFIGSQVIRDLLSNGADVHVIDNFFTGDRSLLPPNVTLTEAEITSSEAQEAIREYRPSGIVHLAALHYIPYCNEHPEETVDVNVIGTQSILGAAEETESVESVVFSSSAAVYPPRDTAHTESDNVGPIDIYGRTKAIGEDVCELFHRRTEVPVTVARLFNTYGPRETNPHLIPAIVGQLNEPPYEIELGNLSPKRDFVHVRDVSRAIVSILEEHRCGIETYNIGFGNARSVREVVEAISNVLGEDIHVIQANDRTRESDRPHLEASIKKIHQHCGWEPTVSFEAGLEEILVEHGVIT